MKNSADIQGIDLSCVTAATIDAKSPAFLIDELRKQFIDFGYEDDFDMQEQLCENIEFVFGPPGTGKTTYLARNVLLPLMAEDQDYKVLVLTPTNKAADVIVRRVMEIAGTDRSYEKWLVRFGATGDDDIEQSPVYKDKTFDIRTMAKNITVTTIARAGATEINVRGEYPGKYYLVPYNGKLKKFTDKKTIPQFIPQIWFGNEKLVAVSVILEDHIIFIEKNTFKMYQKGLCASDSVELVMRPNIRE